MPILIVIYWTMAICVALMFAIAIDDLCQWWIDRQGRKAADHREEDQ